MNYTQLKSKTWFKIISNKYVIILLVFGVWMLFFDSNSWLIHQELDQELKELKNNKTYYEEEILNDKKTIKDLNHPVAIEKYARENYFMKKDNEEVFIIEYQDSLKTTLND
ncbi:MAG: FtsB family cell division protein [Mesonia hippocampi]|uniref:FtsB family cell division protein n=1 Tax=Mesonia hippocampi TaxID=1628250 RepID=UPI003F96AB7B